MFCFVLFCKNMFNTRQRATKPMIKRTMGRPRRNRQMGRHSEKWEDRVEQVEVTTEGWGQTISWAVRIQEQQPKVRRAEMGGP